MIKFLIINKYGDQEIMERETLPRVGDHVDMFYKPEPVVKKVVWWPQHEKLAHLNLDAVVFLD